MSVRQTNQFWSVSLEHTLFLDFLKLVVNMRLAVSFARRKKIVVFGPTDQKLWVFEVSRRSLGKAGMCWSQPIRVDHLHKKWRAGRKKISRKMGTAPQVQVSTHGQWATASRRPALGRRPTNSNLWSPDCRRPTVGAWSPSHDQTPTSGRRAHGSRLLGQFTFV
jgi:hypothetical protein